MAERLSRELVLRMVADVSGATRMESAVNRIQDKVKRVTEAQMKMATSSHNASQGMMKMALNTEAVLKSLDRFSPRLARTAYGLNSLVGKIGAVNAGLGVMAASWAGRKIVGGARVGMAYNSNMEVAIERMGAEIRQDNESMRSAMARSKVETGWAMKYSREAKIFSSDTIQHALSDFAVLYRGDMNKARQATQLATLLAAKNPHQGIEGAKIAIQEAESGQWTSPSRRFFLPKNMLEKYKDRGGLGALQATLADMRIGPGLLQAMGNTAPGMEKQLGAMKQQLAGQATTGLYQARKEHLAFVREKMEGLTSEKGALTQISKLTGELGGKLGKMFYGVLEFPVRNADKILGFLKNLKKGLDPMIAVLKAFGKGVYAGFIGPFQMVVRQLQFTGGVMGKIAGIASKLIGMGGKVATSPLYMLAPLANLLGKGAGTALAGKTVMKASRYVGGPRGLYDLAKKAGPAGKRLWRELGIPLFPGEGALHYGDQKNDGVGPNGYEPDDESKARIVQAAKKAKRKGGGGGRAPRHKGAQDFASILAQLIENSSAGGIIGGMAGGSLADVLERQFLNKLSFFDDLAKAGENLSTVIQGMFEGMQGLLSPVNALGAAVGTLITPFVLLGKVLKVVTAPLNSKAGHLIGKAAGTLAGPLMMPAMFALGTVGGVNMFKQLGGMVTEGGGAFKKGWTKRVFNSFLMGTDFKDGSRGTQGAGYVGMAGGYLQKGIGKLQGLIGRPRLDAYGNPFLDRNGVPILGFRGGAAGGQLHGLLGRYSGLISQGIGGQSPIGAGVEALSQTGDALLDRMPPHLRGKAITQIMKGVRGGVGAQQDHINRLRQQRARAESEGMGLNELGKIDKQIAYMQRGVARSYRALLGPDGAPTTLDGTRKLAAQVKRNLGGKPIEETLQDTIEKMWVKTPDWLSELPIWHREAPNWLIQLGNIMNRGPVGGGGTGGGNGGGGTNIPFQGPSQRRRRARGPGQAGGGRPGGGGAPSGGAAGAGAGGGNLGGLPLPNSGYDPLGPMLGPDPAPPSPAPGPGPGPGPRGPRFGGLLGSLSDTFDKVNGWSSALGLKFTGNRSVRRMLVGARRLQRGVEGLPAAGLGILQGAITSSGLGAKASMANLGGFLGAARTGLTGHLGTLLGGVTGGGASLASTLGSHLSGVGGVLGKAPGLAMTGLNSIHSLMARVFPEMWPILLGGSAIAGITAIAKRVVGKFGEFGGGLRGGIGLARAGYSIVDGQLRNVGQKVGSVGGGILGGGAAMLLASKVPGILKIPAMLLAGYFGAKGGSALGGTLGGNMGAALPGALLAGLAGFALKRGGAGLMAGRGLNTWGGMLGRGMHGAGTLLDLPGTLAARAFGKFDARFLGSRYANARGAFLGGAKGALPFLEESAMRGVARGGMVGRLSGTGLRMLSAFEVARGGLAGGGTVDKVSAALGRTILRGGAVGKAATVAARYFDAARAGMAVQGGAWNSALGKAVVTPKALDGKILGAASVLGRFLLRTKLGKGLLAAGVLTGVAGLGESTVHANPGAGMAGLWQGTKDRASGTFQALGGTGMLKQLGLGGAALGGLMLKTGGLARLGAMRGVGGGLARLLFSGAGVTSGMGAAITRVGLQGLLRGGAGMIAKRGLMAIPGIGQAIGAGMGGWDIGRFAGSHVKWGGKSLDSHLTGGMYRRFFGGNAADARMKAEDAKYEKIMQVARMKREGKVSAAQAKAMVAEINRTGDDGAKQVGDAARRAASMLTLAAVNPFATLGNGGTIGAGQGAYNPRAPGFIGPNLPFTPGGGKGWGHTAAASGLGGSEIDKQVALTAGALAEKIAAQKRNGSTSVWDDAGGAVRRYNGYQFGNNRQNPNYTKQIRGYYDSKPWEADMKLATGARLAEMQRVNSSTDATAKLKGLDPNLLKALMWHESLGWQPGKRSSDGKGGGLGQNTGYFPPQLGSPKLGKLASPVLGGPMSGAIPAGGGANVAITVNAKPSLLETANQVRDAFLVHPEVKSMFTGHVLSTISSTAGQKAITQRTGAPKQ